MSVKPILITGGTGHLGRDLLLQLHAQGWPIRAFARHPGNAPGVEWIQGDLATGVGIAEAVRNVDVVIHAATFSPIARRGSFRPIDFFTSPSAVDVDGTRRLLEECKRAGVKNFLYVSIAGLDGSGLPYSKVKLAGERLVRESTLAWSVVRVSPFYYLLERMLAGLRWLPVWPVPDVPVNPVDTSDVAAYLVECLGDWKNGIRDDIGGPDALSFVQLAREYQHASGIHRPILSLRVSARTALKMGLAEAHGRRGSKSWSTWLSERRPAHGPLLVP